MMSSDNQMRLDVALVHRNIAKSRTLATTLIRDGKIEVNGKVQTKSSYLVHENDDIVLVGELPKYVGRGGYKLEHAIEQFGLDLKDKVCLDAGASTGGFTQCLLLYGAKQVFAVDVGQNQLDESLRNDARVISYEKTDIREASDKIAEKVDFACGDLSFISLTKVLLPIKEMVKIGGELVLLIKPQFEVGKANLNKNGIVKNEKRIQDAIDKITQFATSCGCTVKDVIPSPITGGDGNKEFLLYLQNH